MIEHTDYHLNAGKMVDHCDSCGRTDYPLLAICMDCIQESDMEPYIDDFYCYSKKALDEEKERAAAKQKQQAAVKRLLDAGLEVLIAYTAIGEPLLSTKIDKLKAALDAVKEVMPDE